ncbi:MULTISPECIES: peroxiredoxin [Shewanella]|jgi:peroxiredoxin (alkyl hydroperoxide reductase subunit C)|uniref:peroxiredoxin n=2 Tax=Shewanellaceae TaxID=267890 RepID=UPI001CD594F5|nr:MULTISPECIES: peroxiredoxin [Shewanella]MBZ4678465.1 Peroxiredoxin [Shewanella sp.]MCA0952205.1 peroxiredoxin [Shewanella chilikensis]MCE9854088.1 peroxiredoxin [Shewanella chilikensis]MCL1160298.1 peroxiredoxin [Shewanella chilikensis]
MTEQTTVAAMPGLNEAAPPFTAKTTQGTLSLEDYKGKWLVLFSHPADFTPVYTTEFMAFAQASADFTALNCELMGLSIDGVHAHIAWARSVKDNFGVEINFPIIADLNMKIAGAYGMVQPGASNTSAVHATFVIAPEGVLRAMLYYPMSNGRSVAEILRLVEALQTSDANVCATPESWIPGNEVIVPPPATAQEAEVLKVQGYN